MKAIVDRLKSVLQASAALSAVKRVELVSPKLLPDISLTLVPFIGIAPVNTSEGWRAQRKEAIHRVDLYLVNRLEIQESAITGDSVKQGLLEFTANVSNVIRGHRLPATTGGTDYYLSKPIEIKNIEYVTAGYGDNVFLLVATMTIECTTLFNITLP